MPAWFFFISDLSLSAFLLTVDIIHFWPGPSSSLNVCHSQSLSSHGSQVGIYGDSSLNSTPGVSMDTPTRLSNRHFIPKLPQRECSLLFFFFYKYLLLFFILMKVSHQSSHQVGYLEASYLLSVSFTSLFSAQNTEPITRQILNKYLLDKQIINQSFFLTEYI